LKIKVTDSYFSGSNVGVEEYLNGQIRVTDDVYTADLKECHLNLLEQFAIKAQIVAPVVKNNELFGLLIANQCSEARAWQPHEVDLFVQLAKQVGFAIEQVIFLEKQEAEAEKSNLLADITLRIRQAQFLEDLLKTTVKEVRRALKIDRVLIYGLDSTSWDGIVVAESVAPGWPQTLRVRLNDPCFRNQYVEKYKNGHITVINDIYQDSRSEDCYRERLEQFAVKASLVAPILKNNQVIVHGVAVSAGSRDGAG
jgi:twitching motility protein PilJ